MRHELPRFDDPEPVRLTQLSTADGGLYALDSEGRLWRYYPNQVELNRSRWLRVPGPVEGGR